MRRFSRWMLGAVTNVSLGCFLLIAGIWLRSQWGTDSFLWMSSSGKSGVGVDCSSGSVMLYSLWGNTRREGSQAGVDCEMGLPRRDLETEMRHAPHARVTSLGFGAASWGRAFFVQRFRTRYEGQAAIIFPLWCVVLLAAAPAALFSGLFIQRRQAGRRHCADCGHFLGASMQKCPWCGKVRERSY